MIIDRKLEADNDGTVHLYTTYDIGMAADLAKDVSNNGGGRMGSGNSEKRLMGYIPPEMWSYDPWLITAKRAIQAGDKGEYTKYVRKFFDVHKEYQVFTPKKFF